MKYISFVVPSYNSQASLERCVDTLIPDNTDIEIIIVNDGSTDRTAEIADAYKEKYPDTVRVIHKKTVVTVQPYTQAWQQPRANT